MFGKKRKEIEKLKIENERKRIENENLEIENEKKRVENVKLEERLSLTINKLEEIEKKYDYSCKKIEKIFFEGFERNIEREMIKKDLLNAEFFGNFTLCSNEQVLKIFENVKIFMEKRESESKKVLTKN